MLCASSCIERGAQFNTLVNFRIRKSGCVDLGAELYYELHTTFSQASLMFKTTSDRVWGYQLSRHSPK
jgi:hypothetical protein